MTEAPSQPPKAASTETFDLQAAASAFCDKFPDFALRTTFVDLSTGAVLNADPDKLQAALELIGNSETGKKELQPLIAKCRLQKTSYAWPDGQGNHIVLIYTGDDRPSFFGPGISPARELRFIFNHETGHVLVPEGGSDNRLKAENAADAYALLCDLQEHGGDTSLAEAALLFRATCTMFMRLGILNFSSPLIEKMLEQREELTKEPLTPGQTVALAGKLAVAHTMEISAAEELHASLERLKGHPELGLLKDIVLETPLPETFKWTSTVLKAVLDRRITLKGHLEEEFAAARETLPHEMEQRRQYFSRKNPTPP